VTRSTLFRDFVPVLTQIMFWALLIGAALVFRATVCIYIVASEQEQVDCYNSSKCQSSEALHLMVPYYIGSCCLCAVYACAWREDIGCLSVLYVRARLESKQIRYFSLCSLFFHL
jgi:hypothetical protein